MKRSLLSLVALLAGFASVGIRQRSPATTSPILHQESAGGTVARVLEPRRDDDDVKRAEVRTMVREHEAGTYIGDILLERDSALARWHDRPGRPVTVWVQPITAITDWTPHLVTEAQAAFKEWDALHLPVRFTVTNDSAHAEVRVTWIDHFTEPISGRTRWARDDNWWITEASIVLAVHHQDGETLDPDAMKAMALHEVGHLLGLDHTNDPDAIMSPRVRVRGLTAVDEATVRLLYSLPAGAIR